MRLREFVNDASVFLLEIFCKIYVKPCELAKRPLVVS